MTIKKVLITGAAGYLAQFIIQRLRPKYELTLTDRVEPKPDFKDLPFVQGDITNYAEIEKACEGQDAVVHLVKPVSLQVQNGPNALFMRRDETG